MLISKRCDIMRANGSSKSNLTKALLHITTLVSVFSLFLITRIDGLVNGELYNYGLRFSYEWAISYSNYTQMLMGSLIVTVILMGLSIASFSAYDKTRNGVLRSVSCVLLTAGVGLTIFSGYLFTRLDHLINYTLYQYGLQFSIGWAATYWLYSRLFIGIVFFTVAASSISAVLVPLSSRRKVRVTSTIIASSLLVTTGVVSLALSVILDSSILVLIGLGLVFWGIIFVYIRTEKHVKKTLLDKSVFPLLASLNQAVHQLGFEGYAIYLPPKYLKEPDAQKILILKRKETVLPKPEQIQNQSPPYFIGNSPSILLTAHGAELTRLFEKTLGINLTNVGLQYLQKKMPKLFKESLEIAQDFNMEVEDNRIRVRMENCVFQALNRELGSKPSISSQLGSPLSSAIAISIAKATGKPVIIEREQSSEDGSDLIVDYRVLEKAEPASL
jgi:hypothetical protein